MMNEKPKRKQKPSSLLQRAVPLWVVIGMSLIFIFLLLLMPLSEYLAPPSAVGPVIFTAVPEHFGAPQTDRTYIEPLSSPTAEIESTPEVDVSTNTPLCSDLERSDNGQFVFRMFLQIGMELFRIDEDGTDFCRLTDNTGNDDYPAWSPDGTKIAYVSNDGAYGLYLMDADGGNIELLDTGGSAYSYPAWSPDGKYLVFQATFDEVFDIYRLELATGDIINLTNQERLDTMPSYSPDGQYIVFTSDRTFNPAADTNLVSQDNSYDIYMMDSDGFNSRRLTVDHRSNAHPSFSPDGSQIVYETWAEISIMNRDGSDSHELTNGDNPLWLPDGRIAYTFGGIHTILPDGTEDHLITEAVPLFGSGIQQLDYTPPR